jgi:hypothetical protein
MKMSSLFSRQMELIFWGTGCTFCVMEHPEQEQARTRVKIERYIMAMSLFALVIEFKLKAHDFLALIERAFFFAFLFEVIQSRIPDSDKEVFLSIGGCPYASPGAIGITDTGTYIQKVSVFPIKYDKTGARLFKIRFFCTGISAGKMADTTTCKHKYQ